MSSFSPFESLGFHCNLTFKAFSAALEKQLSGEGISRVQFMALAHLIALGTMPQKELAELLTITPASTVRLVDRLVRDGWVERIPDPDDRRVKLISPMPKAVKTWQDVSGNVQEITARAHAGIPDDQINTVKIVLKKVRENLKRD
jgi:DNA-binding MarR family transcriptional regulator